MVYKRGNVYLANLDSCGAEDIRGKRPILVLEMIGDKKIKVIPISSAEHRENRHSYPMHLVLKGVQKRVWLLCDKEMIIDSSCIKTQIGEISHIQLANILKLSTNQEQENKVYEKNITAETNEEFITLSKGKEEIWEEYLSNINEKVNMMTSTKEIWKERFIGFLFGIAASVIASFIWALLSNS